MKKVFSILALFAVLSLVAPAAAETIGKTGSVAERAAASYKAQQKLDGSSWSFLAPSVQENIGSKDNYLQFLKSFKSFKVTGYLSAAAGVNEDLMLAAMLGLPENNFLAVVTARVEACLTENGTCYRIVHQTVWSWQQPPGAKKAQWYLVSESAKEE